MAFRDQGAFWGRHPHQADPCGRRHQCRRPHGAARAVARNSGMGGDQAYRSQRQAIRQQAPKARDFINRPSAIAALLMRSSGPKPNQIERAGQSRASDRGRQAGVRLCQSALSRTEEEHPSFCRDLRTGQSVHRAPASVALPADIQAETSSAPKTATNPPRIPGTLSHWPWSRDCP